MESERRHIEEGRGEARSAATARVTVIARIFLLAARLCDRRVVLKIINKNAVGRNWESNLATKTETHWPVRSPHRLPKFITKRSQSTPIINNNNKKIK